jgi:hypothetical protein
MVLVLVYCILASCYIRLTPNICSVVHQCNTFTSYFLLIIDMFRPHTAIFRKTINMAATKTAQIF